MGDKADGFIQEQREALGLLALGALGELQGLMGKGPRAEFSDGPAIEQNQALFNVFIGLASGAEPALGEKLGDPLRGLGFSH